MTGDDHQTPFVARLGENDGDEIRCTGIQTRERLVDEEDSGIGREAPIQGDPTARPG